MLTSLQCRAPSLNVLMQKCGFVSLCDYSREPENIEHFLLNCKRFADIRHRSIFQAMTLWGIPIITNIFRSVIKDIFLGKGSGYRVLARPVLKTTGVLAAGAKSSNPVA